MKARLQTALLTAVTMVAFAANSLLNRVALAGAHADAPGFASARLLSRAAMLMLLWFPRRRTLSPLPPASVTGVLALLVYMLGFSAAYVRLDAGLGALVLFGCVQITMFAGALAAGESMPPRRWLGAATAFAGLVWLLWPGGTPAASASHAWMMALAGAGWGIYSLAGRGASDPLGTTTGNFALAAPVALLCSVVVGIPGADLGDGAGAGSRSLLPGLDATGLALACFSGAVTSGLGYALWYRVLAHLRASVAAVAQLTVPVIAIAGGAVILGEIPTPAVALAGIVVLGGVALAVLPLPSHREHPAN